MKALAARLAGFSALPVLSAIIPLFALPIIARLGTEAEWTALVVGQAVGAYASTIGYVGWNVLGTARLAQTKDEASRTTMYAESFYCRTGILIFVAPVSGVVAGLLVPADAFIDAFLYAVGASFIALSLSWFAVGVGTPTIVMRYDLLPKLGFTLAAVIMAVVTNSPVWYAVGLAIAPLFGITAFSVSRFRRLVPQWPGLRPLIRAFTLHRAAWGVEATGGLYSNIPTPVAAAVTPVAVAASFGSADKIYRYALLTVLAVGNAFQGWVLEQSGARRQRRSRIALLLMTTQAIVGAVLLGLLGPWLSAVLFGEALAGEPSTMWVFSIAFFCICVSTPLIRNVIIPAGMARGLFYTTLSGAVIGVTTMVWAGLTVGAPGVAAGLAASEAWTLGCSLILSSLAARNAAARA